MTSEPRKIHGMAEITREKGDFLTSLKHLDEAVLSYQKEEDYLGLSDALSSRFLTYKLLFQKSGDRSFIILAKHSIEASVEVAEEKASESALSLPYFNLAEYYREFADDYPKAISFYNKSIEIMESNPPEEHKEQLPGLLFNMKASLQSCEYLNGDKSAAGRLLESTESIKDHHHKYERDVWMSGGYMKLADILQNDEPDRSNEFLQKAKEIIDSNPDLTIRARQWQQLADFIKKD